MCSWLNTQSHFIAHDVTEYKIATLVYIKSFSLIGLTYYKVKRFYSAKTYMFIAINNTYKKAWNEWTKHEKHGKY